MWSLGIQDTERKAGLSSYSRGYKAGGKSISSPRLRNLTKSAVVSAANNGLQVFCGGRSLDRLAKQPRETSIRRGADFVKHRIIAPFLDRLLRAVEAVALDRVSLMEMARPAFSLASRRVVTSLSMQVQRLGTVIDAGANIGQFAVAAHRAFPDAEIYSFEPTPRAFATLQEVLSSIPGAHAFECALGSSSGTVPFYHSDYSHISSVLPVSPANEQPQYNTATFHVANVEVRALDDIFASTQLRDPVLLKLDVQGFEGEVLAGAQQLLPRVEWVLIECPFTRLYERQLLFPELDALVRSLGYLFVAPVGFQRGLGGAIIEMDCLYRREDSA